MLPHQPIGAATVLRFERPQDRLVVADDGLAAIGKAGRDGPEALDRVVEADEQIDQAIVPRRLVEQVVEGVDRGADALDVDGGQR